MLSMAMFIECVALYDCVYDTLALDDPDEPRHASQPAGSLPPRCTRHTLDVAHPSPRMTKQGDLCSAPAPVCTPGRVSRAYPASKAIQLFNYSTRRRLK